MDPHAKDYPYELNQAIDLTRQSNYEGAAAFLNAHHDQCKASKDCVFEIEIIYGNWAIDFENAGDWQGARTTYQACLTALPDDPSCTGRLADLESKHHF